MVDCLASHINPLWLIIIQWTRVKIYPYETKDKESSLVMSMLIYSMVCFSPFPIRETVGQE